MLTFCADIFHPLLPISEFLFYNCTAFQRVLAVVIRISTFFENVILYLLGTILCRCFPYSHFPEMALRPCFHPAQRKTHGMALSIDVLVFIRHKERHMVCCSFHRFK